MEIYEESKALGTDVNTSGIYWFIGTDEVKLHGCGSVGFELLGDVEEQWVLDVLSCYNFVLVWFLEGMDMSCATHGLQESRP